jgi:3-phenylpropionate/trans-cinnamate dioxygenase ferredoxin reductase subunit
MRLESWQNAQDQAISAARAMLGLQVEYRPAPFFWSQQYDAMVQIAGICRPGARIVTREVDSEKTLIAELDADGRLLCAISTNFPREFRQLRKLVAAGMRVNAARFADPSVPLTSISA